MINTQNCSQKSDEELVRLSLENSQYYACLVSRYEGKILRYIQRISGLGKDDGEDVLQDVFISVYKNLNGFDTNLKFSSWIYRIAHNKVISYWRKNKTHFQLENLDELEFLRTLAEEEKVSEKLDKEYAGEKVNEVISKLDEKYQEVLVLKFLEDKSYEEISDILEKPMGTVATLISRAKKQFLQESQKVGIKFN